MENFVSAVGGFLDTHQSKMENYLNSNGIQMKMEGRKGLNIGQNLAFKLVKIFPYVKILFVKVWLEKDYDGF